MLLACKEGWELLKRQWGWLKQNEHVIPVLLGICISLNVVQHSARLPNVADQDHGLLCL